MIEPTQNFPPVMNPAKSRSPIRTRNRIALLAAVIPAALAAPLAAQVYQAPPSGGGGSEPPQNSGNGGNTTIVNQRSSQRGNLLGDTLPFLDPGSEVVSWDGQNWSIMDQRVFRARFEKYLNAPAAATEEDRAYRETVDAILAALSPHGGGPNLQKAVALLPKASTFPIDARLCDSISSAIFAVYSSQKNVAGMTTMNQQLDEQRKQLEWNVEVASEPPTLAPAGENGANGEDSGGGGGDSPEQVALQVGRVGGYIKRMAEIEAMKQANRAKVEITALNAKIEFQALIVQFFLQRRFEHVLIGCRLYRALFDDGDSKLHIEKNSDVEKLFGQSLGVNPTISTLDAFASEAIRDVDEGVEAFKFLVSKDELDSGSKRLAEAFTVGEYLEKVRTLPLEEKRKVVDYVRNSNMLISALEVKDYTLAEELVEKMRAQAKDFDYAKPMAAINTARTVADMQLSKAKNAMLRGNSDEMAEAIKNATEVWPTNPKLREVGELVDKGSNVESQALIDLQGLIAQKNFRQIHRDQARYILAVRNDPERQEQLREIIEDVTAIDMTLVQADKLAESGNKWAAWEGIEEMYRQFPEDNLLNQKRADLSTEVAPFVSALETARQLEEKDQTGSSLAWYLKARKIYPNSSIAREGMNRLIEEILPDSPAGAVATDSSASPAPAESDELEF